jgi:hypothetical protein
MRRRLLVLVVLGSAGLTTLSLIRAQDRPAAPAATPRPAAADAPASPGPPPAPARDFSKYSPLQKQMLLSARRGADWLFRMNEVKGRFVHGHVPALRAPLEGDHYLRQAGAAFALARAARFTGEERHAARAAQAVLALLDETGPDPNDAQVRSTTLPPLVVNRLGAAALLVLAINELPEPQADLLEKSEQLCQYIRRQARPDGSLRCGDAPDTGAPADEADGVAEYPGAALYALMRSHPRRPAAWKVDLVRKAAAYYRPWWRSHTGMAFVPWQTAAYAEAYLLTHEAPFAEFVAEMNDFVCGLQYERIDPRRQLWQGGFMSWADGRPVEAPPDVGSAAYAEGLAQACRVARAQGDVPRHQRYSDALERCLQFLCTLQYTEASTQHFADWYRPALVGGFHASHQDGNLRIDYAQHAVSALVLYLEHVAR